MTGVVVAALFLACSGEVVTLPPTTSPTGAASITVNGLDAQAASGGTAVVTKTDDATVTPVTAPIPPSGFAIVNNIPTGAYRVDYTAPSGFRLIATDDGMETGTVTEDDTTSVSFTVERIPLPPAGASLALAVTRLDGGNGSTLVSNGIPLAPGDLMPSAIANARVVVNGVEQAIYIEALRGKHADGSLRSVLVQFTYSVNDGSPVAGTFDFGPTVTRTTTDITKTTPPSVPAAVALPTDPDYLVTTGILLHPALTVATIRTELSGTVYEAAIDEFIAKSDLHWNTYGADFINTSHLYDRPLNHYTFWAMTGDVKYWMRATENAIVSRQGSTNTPVTVGVAPRFFQPDGYGMHYLATGDETAIDFLMGGITRLSVIALNSPVNVTSFGGPGVGQVFSEGRVRARVLIGHIWAWLLEDVSQAWGLRADTIINRMIAGQNADGSFTHRLGTDNTPAVNLRYGQSNFMEGMVMDGVIKYYNVRAQNPGIVTMIQNQVNFLDATEWDVPSQAWHYWSPAAAWDIGDLNVGLANSDELNTLVSIGHFWLDFINGTATNQVRGDEAWNQTLGPSGTDLGVPFGRKPFNQVFYSGLAQIYYRQR